MNAICLRGRGGPEAFAYEEAPQPRPGEGEVLVRVHAAGVIHTELSWVPTWTTQAGEPRPLPVIPGHEFSGEIAALGAGVRDLGVGDLVYGLNDWYRNGAQADYCVALVADCAPKPASVDHIHAAATPISALTAWQGLVERAGLAAGQRVLIHGAAGGVGTIAVQLAHWRGARVTGTASAANLDFVPASGPTRRSTTGPSGSRTWSATWTWSSTRSAGRRWRGPGACSSPEAGWSPSRLQANEQPTSASVPRTSSWSRAGRSWRTSHGWSMGVRSARSLAPCSRSPRRGRRISTSLPMAKLFYAWLTVRYDVVRRWSSNQSMKPTPKAFASRLAPLRRKISLFATPPCRGLSLSR